MSKWLKRVVGLLIMLLIILWLVRYCSQPANIEPVVSNVTASVINNKQEKNKVINIAADAQSSVQIDANATTILNTNGWIVNILDSPYKYIDTTVFYLKDTKKVYLINLVAHAESPKFNGLRLSRIIEKINEFCNLDTNTVIYLNGCNTGLRMRDNCNLSAAQILANNVGCIVYGSRGYLRGTFAQQNEKCTRNNRNPTDAYPGAKDTIGSNVWTRCKPIKATQGTCVYKEKYELSMATSSLDIISTFTTRELTQKELTENGTLYSMFPDIIFEYKKNEYALYNRLNYLYDVGKNKIYQTNLGEIKELVENLE